MGGGGRGKHIYPPPPTKKSGGGKLPAFDAPVYNKEQLLNEVEIMIWTVKPENLLS
jgi:hypothetical protein